MIFTAFWNTYTIYFLHSVNMKLKIDCIRKKTTRFKICFIGRRQSLNSFEMMLIAFPIIVGWWYVLYRCEALRKHQSLHQPPLWAQHHSSQGVRGPPRSPLPPHLFLLLPRDQSRRRIRVSSVHGGSEWLLGSECCVNSLTFYLPSLP